MEGGEGVCVGWLSGEKLVNAKKKRVGCVCVCVQKGLM